MTRWPRETGRGAARAFHPAPYECNGRNGTAAPYASASVDRSSSRCGSRAQFYYTVQSDDAAAAAEVRMAKVSLAGVEVDLGGFSPTTYVVDGGSRGVPPVLDAIGLSSFFFVPADGVYRPGDEIYWFARFHKAVTVSGAPVLT